MLGHPILLNGVMLDADLTGALHWPERETLVVADLHLEKGSTLGHAAAPLPPYDTDETLDRLEEVIARRRPARVICLGDSFHDRDAADLLPADLADRVRSLTTRHDWIWVTGNHDPDAPRHLGGTAADEVTIGGLVFRHEARAGAVDGEISGHYHPKARVRVRGRGISGRCFVGDGRRLILPAFGAYAGGLDVRDPVVRRLFGRRWEILFIGRSGLHRFPGTGLARRAGPTRPVGHVITGAG
jgi:DNA ligase-associated metallophosphoesterase